MKIFALAISIASTFALPITTNGFAGDAFSASYLEKIPGAAIWNAMKNANQNIGQINIPTDTFTPKGTKSIFETFPNYLNY